MPLAPPPAESRSLCAARRKSHDRLVPYGTLHPDPDRGCPARLITRPAANVRVRYDVLTASMQLQHGQHDPSLPSSSGSSGDSNRPHPPATLLSTPQHSVQGGQNRQLHPPIKPPRHGNESSSWEAPERNHQRHYHYTTRPAVATVPIPHTAALPVQSPTAAPQLPRPAQRPS